MIYSLILVAIDSRENKNPPLAWNSGKGSAIDREAWPARKKSYFFKVYSYHSWFGVAIATEGLRVGGELKRSQAPES